MSAQHFHRPSTVEEALALKREQGDVAAFLGGGTLLNSLDQATPPVHLISLAGLGLDGIEDDGKHLVLGACCTLQQLLDSDVPESIREGCRHVENRSVRNMATLGGLLGGADSTRDLLPILVALQARVDLAGSGDVALLDYFAAPAGLITAVRVPLVSFQRSWALGRHGPSASSPSTITAAATLQSAAGQILTPILAIGGVADTLIRMSAVERALDGEPLPETNALEALIASDLRPVADHRGSAEYKRLIAGVIGAQVLRDALQGGAR